MIQAPTASEPKPYGLYVDGAFTAAGGATALPVINPATRETWATIADATPDDVDRAVTAARRAFDGEWSRVSPATRGRLLHKLADAVEARADELAELEVRDNGKLLREMRAQLKAVPGWYRYFAGLADKLHGDTIPMERASLVNFTYREPLGVIAMITAWNSPLLLLAYKLAPALAAGNTAVVKPSEHASISTLEFAKCVESAGFPAGVFNVVTGLGATAGDALVRHRGVDRVSFTGSGGAGAVVAARAVSHFASVGLELGGKSPNIVFEDAPLDAAISGLLAGIFAAAGQTCVAGSRALVHRSVYAEVQERLRERARTIVMGDPMRPDVEMGPMANEPQYEKVQQYVAIAKGDGAKLIAGGACPADESLQRGFYFEPTVFADVHNQMRIAREEVFGPVLSIIPFDTEDEALAIANDTEYGLGAGVWTNDLGRAHRMARALRAGSVWVNTYRAVGPSMPFGGYKSSGIGRENGIDALHDYTQLKGVWIETEPTAG
ncbi:MAG: (Z)-2-((N-methylformamido)methylene)-5-hydroxybutyrolactone dehydrogenase, partial [Candidatus Eremiobacteraeota bacterium]|nr:(Z)-2-((N-methylformamido)methylene)-5-hydroxybutyrolactone dehydrogenase [Candidatus Eremiobacteraeota bacterium]